MEVIDAPWWAAPRTPIPPPDRVRAMHEVLARYGAGGHGDFCERVATRCGLFWEPWPPPRMRWRDIARQARAEFSAVGQAMRRAARFQTIRGGRIIPLGGPHERRRPSPEIDRALGFWDRALQDLPRMTRYHCLAELLGAVAGTSGNTAHAAARVRKRLAKSPVTDLDYEFTRWRFEQESATPWPVLVVESSPGESTRVVVRGWRSPHQVPFPHAFGFHVTVAPRPDGEVSIELAPDGWLMRPQGMPVDAVATVAVEQLKTAMMTASAWPPPVELVAEIVAWPVRNALAFEVRTTSGVTVKGLFVDKFTVELSPAPRDVWIQVVAPGCPSTWQDPCAMVRTEVRKFRAQAAAWPPPAPVRLTFLAARDIVGRNTVYVWREGAPVKAPTRIR